MKEQDKQSFDKKFPKGLSTESKNWAMKGFRFGLEHRDKQAGEPIYQTQNPSGLWEENNKQAYDYNTASGWKTRVLYTATPAVAVNEQMLVALERTRSEIWRLLDAKGVDPKAASEWPEIILADAAIAAAKAARGE